MHRISLAPVLSATRSRDSCWITVRSPTAGWFSRTHREPGRTSWIFGGSTGGGPPVRDVLLGLLEDLHQAPPLGRGQRAGLHDQDTVADAGGVLLVVHLDLLAATQHLAVERVLDAVLDDDD